MRVNWLAIVVSAVVFYLVGWLWYGMLFKTAWMAAVALPAGSMSMGGGSAYPFIISFVAAIVLAYGVARVLSWRGPVSPAHGAFIGASMGILFFAAPLWMNYAYQMRGMTLGFIDAGYVIVGMAVQGAIIAAWKPVAAATSAA